MSRITNTKPIKNAAAVLALCIAAAFLMPKTIHSEMIELDMGIADAVLRFHIIANSDSTEDQELKMRVKAAVASQIAEDMAAHNITSKEDAEHHVKNNIEEYIDIAKNIVKTEGKEYGANACVGRCWFPVKIYGNYVFPEGEYDAFRIILGKGEGRNWWCVLFPSLCMVDEAYQVAEEIPASEPALEPTSEPALDTQDDDVKIKFRIIEWLKDMW